MKQISTLLLDKTTIHCSSFSRHASARGAWELTMKDYGILREYVGGNKDWTDARLPTGRGV
jgi:hypothetical protein